MSVIPIKCRKRYRRFDLPNVMNQEIIRNKQHLRDYDIVVVSSKYAAVSEGRLIRLEEVVPSERARSLATQYSLSPKVAQLVLEESDEILGGIPGFSLSLTRGSLVPNAGIDLSNVPEGYAVLYPKDPQHTAKRLRDALMDISISSKSKGDGLRNLGIILSDSRITPTRLGTIGVAIAVAGILSTIDMRGKKDLFEKALKVTIRGIADQLASAAEVVMSEADEAIPIAIIRGVRDAFEEPRNEIEKQTSIDPRRCLILSGLRKGSRNSVAQAFDISTEKSRIESF